MKTHKSLLTADSVNLKVGGTLILPASKRMPVRPLAAPAAIPAAFSSSEPNPAEPRKIPSSSPSGAATAPAAPVASSPLERFKLNSSQLIGKGIARPHPGLLPLEKENLWNHQVILCASSNPAPGVSQSAGNVSPSLWGRSGADHRPGTRILPNEISLFEPMNLPPANPSPNHRGRPLAVPSPLPSDGRGEGQGEVRVHGEGGLKTFIPASPCVATVFFKTPLK
jgi:hypothetical protein